MHKFANSHEINRQRDAYCDRADHSVRQLANDLWAIKRRERMFEALNRPQMRRDRGQDAVAALARLLGLTLLTVTVLGGIVAADSLITL